MIDQQPHNHYILLKYIKCSERTACFLINDREYADLTIIGCCDFFSLREFSTSLLVVMVLSTVSSRGVLLRLMSTPLWLSSRAAAIRVQRFQSGYGIRHRTGCARLFPRAKKRR